MKNENADRESIFKRGKPKTAEQHLLRRDYSLLAANPVPAMQPVEAYDSKYDKLSICLQ